VTAHAGLHLHRSAIAGLTPAAHRISFQTALYFAARGGPGWEVRPLIHDSLVRNALSFLADWLGVNLGPSPRRLVDR
jgi:hypothetical protein